MTGSVIRGDDILHETVQIKTAYCWVLLLLFDLQPSATCNFQTI